MCGSDRVENSSSLPSITGRTTKTALKAARPLSPASDLSLHVAECAGGLRLDENLGDN